MGLVQDFFSIGKSLVALNVMDIFLLPKINNPKLVSHYITISFCNFCYMIISKLMTNRMKSILARFIFENQRPFIPRKLIQDNILVAHFYLKCKKVGKKFEMALKIDMSKAYDQLEWNFLEGALLKLGFCARWVSLIMKYVTFVRDNCFSLVRK